MMQEREPFRVTLECVCHSASLFSCFSPTRTLSAVRDFYVLFLFNPQYLYQSLKVSR